MYLGLSAAFTIGATVARRDRETFVGYRETPEVVRRMDDVAAYFGHTRSEMNRFAWAMCDVRATLAYLDTPEGRLEAEENGGVELAREELLADLGELEAAAFRPRKPPPTPFERAMN
jgi:hypothetical protein